MTKPNREEVERAVADSKIQIGYYPILKKAAEAYLKLTEPVKDGNGRDGNWMDKNGACKVCDGEIPYGHTENCDIYKLEQELQILSAQLAEMVKERDDFNKRCDKMDKDLKNEISALKAEQEQDKRSRPDRLIGGS